jgi:uncharacterized MAPEG superfamily protein
MSKELLAKFEAAKKRAEKAQENLREVLDTMIMVGMAKKIEDGYDGDYQMTIVGAPNILSQIEYFIWEEASPEFFGPDNEPLDLENGVVEWF